MEEQKVCLIKARVVIPFTILTDVLWQSLMASCHDDIVSVYRAMLYMKFTAVTTAIPRSFHTQGQKVIHIAEFLHQMLHQYHARVEK